MSRRICFICALSVLAFIPSMSYPTIEKKIDPLVAYEDARELISALSCAQNRALICRHPDIVDLIDELWLELLTTAKTDRNLLGASKDRSELSIVDLEETLNACGDDINCAARSLQQAIEGWASLNKSEASFEPIERISELRERIERQQQAFGEELERERAGAGRALMVWRWLRSQRIALEVDPIIPKVCDKELKYDLEHCIALLERRLERLETLFRETIDPRLQRVSSPAPPQLIRSTTMRFRLSRGSEYFVARAKRDERRRLWMRFSNSWAAENSVLLPVTFQKGGVCTFFVYRNRTPLLDTDILADKRGRAAFSITPFTRYFDDVTLLREEQILDNLRFEAQIDLQRELEGDPWNRQNYAFQQSMYRKALENSHQGELSGGRKFRSFAAWQDFHSERCIFGSTSSCRQILSDDARQLENRVINPFLLYEVRQVRVKNSKDELMCNLLRPSIYHEISVFRFLENPLRDINFVVDGHGGTLLRYEVVNTKKYFIQGVPNSSLIWVRPKKVYE